MYPRILTINDIEALALGAWILGTGGGGTPYHRLLNMRELYKAGRVVTLIDPMGLADDALVAVLSNMGAPLVGQERLADPDFATKPLRTMEDYLGRKFDAVMSLEIGGGNGVHPLMVAAMTGYPVVDADTMGRAYPEAQMTSVAVAGLQCYPLALADIRDNEVIIPRAASWKWMERISRKACTEVGSIASTCKAPRTGREVKDHGILYTTTQAISLGCAVMEARRVHTDPVQAIVEKGVGLRLFDGKVVDVERRATEGFLRGQARIEGLDRDARAVFTVHFQNEFSVGYRGDAPVVMTPDLICVVDSVSGDGIGTDVIRYGQRVSVLALPS
ncbi:MAG: DUF917 domain-containing protein, partial [Pseudomonadota bacterium]|nr:DUF917 domain-containing protein [Pseudomonadota bacterium]